METGGNLNWVIPGKYHRADLCRPKAFFMLAKLCLMIGLMTCLVAWAITVNQPRKSAGFSPVEIGFIAAADVGGLMFVAGLILYIFPPRQEIRLDDLGLHESFRKGKVAIPIQEIKSYRIEASRILPSVPGLYLMKAGSLGRLKEDVYPLGEEVSEDRIHAWMESHGIPRADSVPLN